MDAETSAHERDRQTAAEKAVGDVDRRMRVPFVVMLTGATLLGCSFAAGAIWEKPLYAALPAAVATALLGAPLVGLALRDLRAGRAGILSK